MQFIRSFGIAAGISLLAIVMTAVFLGPSALLTVLILCALEITFSFDNAVVNAKILEKLSKFWREIFLSVGIIIAVFGMRIIFPVLLVDVTSSLNFGQVIDLALAHPHQYAEQLEHAMPAIAGFGGAFLMMVALSFFIIENNTPYWLRGLEKAVRRLPRHIWTVALITLVAVGLTAGFLAAPEDKLRVLIAGLIGVVVYSLLHLITSSLEKSQGVAAGTVLHGGAAFTTFLYLEVLDASFSLDGVIGAFAITTSVVLIAIGLGVGALWVRSMTVALVRHQTLAKFAHISQGAHWAIAVLAVVLFLSVSLHVPEAITGLVGIGIIIGSLVSSLRRRA